MLRTLERIIAHAGVERRFADRCAVADRYACQFIVQSKRVFADNYVFGQIHACNSGKRKRIIADIFGFGQIGRCGNLRIRKRVRTHRRQFAEVQRRQFRAIGKGIIAHACNARCRQRKQRGVPRKRARGNRRDVRREGYSVARLGSRRNQFRALADIFSVFFRFEIRIRGGQIECFNACSGKRVFADDGNVRAEAHSVQGGATAEGIGGDNSRVDVDGSKIGAARKRALAHFYFRRFEFYVNQFFVVRERADTDRLRRFGQRHRIEFAVFKRIVSYGNHLCRFRFAAFVIAQRIRQRATGKRAFVNELYVFKIDFRQLRAPLERAEPDQVQRGRKHHFFQRRKLRKRILFDGGNAFGNHYFRNRVVADRRLFGMIRRFFIDYVARAEVLFHKLVPGERKRVDRGNAAVVGNGYFAAEASVRVEINAVEGKRFFHRNRNGKHVQRRFAVVGNRRRNRGSAFFLRHNLAVLAHRGVAVTGGKFHLRKRRIVGIEDILQRNAFGRIHRKFVHAAERIRAARRADFSFGGRKRIVRFVRLISGQIEFVHRLQRIRSVVPLFALGKNVHRSGSRKHRVAALLGDNRLV